MCCPTLWSGFSSVHENNHPMKMLKIRTAVLILSTLVWACEQSEDDGLIICPTGTCEEEVQVSDDLYENGPDDELMISNAFIFDDCLDVTFRYGGGCGEVEAHLFASTGEGDSLPPTRSIRVGFKDDDDCEALLVFTKTFDLTPLRSGSYSTVLLQLEGYDEVLEYNY